SPSSSAWRSICSFRATVLIRRGNMLKFPRSSEMIQKFAQVLIILAAAVALAFAQPKQQAPTTKGKGISKKEADAINAVANAKTPDDKIAAAENLISTFADTEYKPWAMQAAAEAAEQKNDFAKAIFYAERALEADPKYIDSL